MHASILVHATLPVCAQVFIEYLTQSFRRPEYLFEAAKSGEASVLSFNLSYPLELVRRVVLDAASSRRAARVSQVRFPLSGF
jgi:hypothetical protein